MARSLRSPRGLPGCLTPHSSPLTPPSSPLTPPSSLLTPHPSPLTPHSSPLTPHSSLLTPHPSPLPPHSSPLTPHSSLLTPRPSLASMGLTVKALDMNTAELSFRVDPALKEQAAQLFQELGLSTSAALRLFLEHAVTCQGLPFDTSLNGDAENGLRNALWARDAERMHAMVMTAW